MDWWLSLGSMVLSCRLGLRAAVSILTRYYPFSHCLRHNLFHARFEKTGSLTWALELLGRLNENTFVIQSVDWDRHYFYVEGVFERPPVKSLLIGVCRLARDEGADVEYRRLDAPGRYQFLIRRGGV